MKKSLGFIMRAIKTLVQIPIGHHRKKVRLHKTVAPVRKNLYRARNLAKKYKTYNI